MVGRCSLERKSAKLQTGGSSVNSSRAASTCSTFPGCRARRSPGARRALARRPMREMPFHELHQDTGRERLENQPRLADVVRQPH
jgi:hypothetical protein